MSRMIHMALSVDVDRFSDAKLRKEVCPGLKINGKHPTVEELRIACYKARLAGLEVFPPCDNVKPNGSCAGHEEP